MELVNGLHQTTQLFKLSLNLSTCVPGLKALLSVGLMVIMETRKQVSKISIENFQDTNIILKTSIIGQTLVLALTSVTQSIAENSLLCDKTRHSPIGPSSAPRVHRETPSGHTLLSTLLS